MFRRLCRTLRNSATAAAAAERKRVLRGESGRKMIFELISFSIYCARAPLRSYAIHISVLTKNTRKGHLFHVGRSFLGARRSEKTFDREISGARVWQTNAFHKCANAQLRKKVTRPTAANWTGVSRYYARGNLFINTAVWLYCAKLIRHYHLNKVECLPTRV